MPTIFLLNCIRREPGIRTETLKQLCHFKLIVAKIKKQNTGSSSIEEHLEFIERGYSSNSIIDALEKSGKAKPVVEGVGAAWWYRWYRCKSKRESKKAFENARNEIRREIARRGSWKKMFEETSAELGVHLEQ